MRKATKIKSNIPRFFLIFLIFGTVSSFCPAAEENQNPAVSPEQLEAIRLQASSFDMHVWDRYVRRFRRDHHIAVTTGSDRGSWYVGSFGRLQESTFRSEGVDSTFQYTFHIQISGKSGYYLGTSTGYFAELRKRRDDDFGPSSMWKLPGLVAGLVYNYDPTGRFFAGGEGYLSRVNQLETRDSKGESQTISVTGESFDFLCGWDKFVSLNWGIRTQYYNRQMWIPPPKNAETYPVDARLRRTSQGVTIGGVYHFL